MENDNYNPNLVWINKIQKGKSVCILSRSIFSQIETAGNFWTNFYRWYQKHTKQSCWKQTQNWDGKNDDQWSGDSINSLDSEVFLRGRRPLDHMKEPPLKVFKGAATTWSLDRAAPKGF